MPEFTDTRGSTELGWLRANPRAIPAVAKATGIRQGVLEELVRGKRSISGTELQRLRAHLAEARKVHDADHPPLG